MNPVEYRAAPSKVMRIMLTCAAFAGIYFWLAADKHLLQAHLHGREAVLEVLPPLVRVFVVGAIGGLLLAAALAPIRLLFNPVVLIIDDEGVSLWTALGWKRGYWTEFYEELTLSTGTMVLKFAGPRSTKSVALGIGLTPFDQEAALTDARRRISRPSPRSQTAKLSAAA